MQTQNSNVFVQTATFNAHMLIALKQKVYELLQANNTITTLEVKLALRKSNPRDTWNQVDVSRAMQFMADNGELTFHDNGTYRTYSMATTLPARSSAGTVTINNKHQQQTGKNVIVPKTTMGKKLAKVKAPKAPVKKETIGKNKALQVIQGTNNKFFGVTFTKKDGSERKMTCRIDKNDLTPTALGYLRVIDTQELGVVKNLNLQTLSEIRTNNTIYKIR